MSATVRLLRLLSFIGVPSSFWKMNTPAVSSKTCFEAMTFCLASVSRACLVASGSSFFRATPLMAVPISLSMR